jgi:hypothetical protein
MLHFLRIEIDGHFHGGPPVRPWVAQITGTDPQYGLARTFVRPLNDWADARRAWSGNVYGIVATFPVYEGQLYEVSHCVGRSSKRRVERYFARWQDGAQTTCEPLEALASVDGGAPAAILRLPEDDETWVAHIPEPGAGQRLGFVLIDTQRHYRLADGLYRVCESGALRWVGVREAQAARLTDEEARAWHG